MPFIIIIIALIAILLLSTTNLFSGGSSMSTLQDVYTNYYDLASNWANVLGTVTPEEILAIVAKESSGDPNAINPGDPSYGLMGVTMLIAKKFGNVTDQNQLFNPATNIASGGAFLAYLKKTYQDTFPLGNGNGWVQMYNEGEPNFLKGERVKSYEDAFIHNYNALVSITNANNAANSGG